MADKLPYVKNFDAWNEHKKRIEKRTGPHAKPGEIWWTYWGVNVGHEMDGKGKDFERPALVLAIFGSSIFVVPTTSSQHGAYTHQINTKRNIKTYVALSHTRCIDYRRFRRLLDNATPDGFINIQNTLIHYIKRNRALRRGISGPSGA
jgi:mRNA interferase MazF